MAKLKSKELYISFNPLVYKSAKQGILRTQADFLMSVRHLNDIKRINSEKSKLKIRLHELFEDVLRNLEKLEKQLPKPEIPKEIHKRIKKSQVKQKRKLEQPSIFEDEYTDKHQKIEKELLEIQEKLKQLTN